MPADELAPSLIGGKYELRGELGQGGSATVYLAHDVSMDRLVAVKVLRQDLGYTLAHERFSREIRVMARLEHPHILPVLDTGTWGDRLYYVMPFVEGQTLEARLRDQKQLPVDEVLRLAHELCDALAHAHSKGIIHRDIKPSNILVGRDGHARLSDFGIARALDLTGDDRLTLSEALVGTMAYMSPEQHARERRVDGRSDVFSLGMVLYECLTGRLPFEAGSATEEAKNRLIGQFPSLRELRSDVPVEVEGAIGRALAPDVDARWGDAREFAEGLGVGLGTSTGNYARFDGSSRNETSAAVARFAAIVGSRRGKQLTGATLLVAAAALGLAVVKGVLPKAGGAAAVSKVVGLRTIAISPLPREGLDSASYRVLSDALREAAGSWLPSPFSAISSSDGSAIRISGAEVNQSECARFQRVGHGALVLPEFASIGDSVRTRLRVIDVEKCREAGGATTAMMSMRGDAPSHGVRRLLASVVAGPGVPPDALEPAMTSNNLAALEHYWRGRTLLMRDSLGAATEEFTAAAGVGELPSALVWLAISEWLGSPRPGERLSRAVQRAASARARSGHSESLALSAVSSLAQREFDEACRGFDQLSNDAVLSHLGRLGKVDCLLHDDRVRRAKGDSAAPYFVAGYESAIESLGRAALSAPEWLLPFLEMRAQILAPPSPALRHGRDVDDSTQQYAALVALSRDTLAHFPLNTAHVRQSFSQSVPPTFAAALMRARRKGMAVSRQLVERFPHSARAHASLADALESLGIVGEAPGFASGAIAENRRAAELTSDSQLLRELALDRVRLFLRSSLFDSVRTLGNRLLLEPGSRRPEVTERLAAVAVLLDRLPKAESLVVEAALKSATDDGRGLPVPSGVLPAYARAAVLSAAGRCGPSLDSAEQAVESSIRFSVRQAMAEDSIARVLSRIRTLAVPCRGLPSALRIRDTSDVLVRLQQALARSDDKRWRDLWEGLETERSSGAGGFVSLDHAFQEAWLVAMAGESQRSLSRVEGALAGLPSNAGLRLDDLASAGSIGRLLWLGERLAVNRGARTHASRLRQYRTGLAGRDANSHEMRDTLFVPLLPSR